MSITRVRLVPFSLALVGLVRLACADASLYDIITSSPNSYFAGIIEYKGPVTCGEPVNGNEFCWNEARVVELFAAKTPDGTPFPKTIRFYVGGPAGRCMTEFVAVVAVPMGRDGVFAAKIMQLLDRADSPTHLRALVKGMASATVSQ